MVLFERLLIVDANLKKAAASISTEECGTETDGIVSDKTVTLIKQ